jgi:hypothetical protein
MKEVWQNINFVCTFKVLINFILVKALHSSTGGLNAAQ